MKITMFNHTPLLFCRIYKNRKKKKHEILFNHVGSPLPSKSNPSSLLSSPIQPMWATQTPWPTTNLFFFLRLLISIFSFLQFHFFSFNFLNFLNIIPTFSFFFSQKNKNSVFTHFYLFNPQQPATPVPHYATTTRTWLQLRNRVLTTTT